MITHSTIFVMAYDTDKYGILKVAAKTYNSAFRSLKALSSLPVVKENEQTYYYGIPIIINQALFCEIALKALIIRDENEYKRIHKLDELFYSLTFKTQELIFDKMGDDVTKKEFTKLLKENNNHFNNWRYFYEKGAVCDAEFMDRFSLAVMTILDDNNLE